MLTTVNPQTPQILVEAHDLRKSFGSLEVLRDIDLTVQNGEVVVIIGPSGCGKSTLLRCFNGLESISGGTLKVTGLQLEAGRPPSEQSINVLRRNVGMVFQRFHLFPHLTVLDNLTLAPRQVLKADPEAARKQALDLLEQVHLADKSTSYPAQLSGGQQQRAAIARALMMEPQLLLFDEPTSALDPELVGEVLEVMRDLANEGMTMMVVTHEMSFAAQVASRVLFLDKGLIVEQGSPDAVLRHPQHARTQEFLSRLLHK